MYIIPFHLASPFLHRRGAGVERVEERPFSWFRRSNIPVAGRETPLCTQFGWAQALGSTSLGVYWLKFPTGAFPVDSARKNGCTMKTGGKGQCTSQDSGDWGIPPA